MRRPLALVLLLAALAVVALAGCGGEEEAAPTAETVIGTLPADTSEEPADTGGDGDGDGGGDAAAGAEIYASAGCGGCHTLADAGSSGSVGPNLDDSQPSHELVVDRVTNGAGAMPAFSDSLSEEDIQNVAAYVSSVAGQS